MRYYALLALVGLALAGCGGDSTLAPAKPDDTSAKPVFTAKPPALAPGPPKARVPADPNGAPGMTAEQARAWYSALERLDRGQLPLPACYLPQEDTNLSQADRACLGAAFSIRATAIARSRQDIREISAQLQASPCKDSLDAIDAALFDTRALMQRALASIWAQDDGKAARHNRQDQVLKTRITRLQEQAAISCSRPKA